MRLRERLKGIIPEDDLASLSNRFHVVGDIAIISVPAKMEIYKADIAETIVSGHRKIRTVLNKVSKLEGDRRVAGFEILAGSETVTVHREFGFCYRLDLLKVFFNSHLGYERRRVALKVRTGESVLVPFCGVGPYVVPVAAAGARVVAVESNSEACKWMTENACLNGVEDNIDLIKGDALVVADLLNIRYPKFDRAIIPTPYGMDQVLDIFSHLVKKGGAIHFYTFKKKHQIEGLIEKYESSGLEVEFYRSCGNVAPGVCRWVFDLVKGQVAENGRRTDKESENSSSRNNLRHIMQISDKIHALKIPFQITDKSGLKVPRFVYVYLIYGEKICLIDSGVASSEKFIFDYLRKTGRQPDDISLLVLTHSHPDHIGSALAIKEASGCAVAAHVAEKAWIEDVDLQSRERPVPGFHSLVGGSVKVDRALKEGDLLDLGGSLNLKVIHTPGHSEGSISLWLAEEGVLFTGDAIPLPGEMPVYDDPQASVKSIKRLKAIVGIEALLAAWDQPRDGEQAYRIMDESLRYLQRIQKAVIKISRGQPTLDLMDLTKSVLNELGMPETMANPMISRSFQANLKVRNHSDLLQD